MATADNSRTPEQVRLELEAEREELADAVDSLRAGVHEVTDVKARVRENLPAFAVGALGLGFFLAGGIGATMRLIARRSREGQEVGRFGRYIVIDRD